MEIKLSTRAGALALSLTLWTAFVVFTGWDDWNHFRIPTWIYLGTTLALLGPAGLFYRYYLRHRKPGPYMMTVVQARAASVIDGAEIEFLGSSHFGPQEQRVIFETERTLTSWDPLLARKLTMMEPLGLVMQLVSWRATVVAAIRRRMRRWQAWRFKRRLERVRRPRQRPVMLVLATAWWVPLTWGPQKWASLLWRKRGQSDGNTEST